MHRRLPSSRSLVVALGLALLPALPGGAGAQDEAAPAPAADAPPGAAEAIDVVKLRREFLARRDAQIDAEATRAHLEARLLVDELLPVAYLGIDADPAPGGMMVTKVFPGSGAEGAGLRVGDVLREVGGDPTTAPLELGRAIRRRKPGDAVALRFRREDADQTATATLSRRPEEDEDEDEQFVELAGGAPPLPAPFHLDLTGSPVAVAPAGLVPALGGHGSPPRWVVHRDPEMWWVRQEDADPTGIRFPVGLARDFDAKDAEATVRFRIADGANDRAAGLVLRWRDPGNYLVARYNATEADLRIFRVVNGLRRTLPGGRVAVGFVSSGWHTLSFRAQGAKLTASIDREPAAESYDTYFVRGGAGLWTKSDSVTDFADFRVAPLAAEPAGK